MGNVYQLALNCTAIYLALRFCQFVSALTRSYKIRWVAPLAKPPPVATGGGPFGLVGLYHLVKAVNKGKLCSFLQDESDRFGSTYMRHGLGSDVIMTTDPENIKAILATQFTDFGLGERHKALYPLLGDGIFTLDGKGWSHSRALLRPQFSREQVADIQQLEIHLKHLMSHIPTDGSPFDIQEHLYRLTLDSSTEFLFGESVNSLVSSSYTQSGIPVKSTDSQLGFEAAFTLSQDYLGARTRAQKLYWLINAKEFRNANRTVHQLVDYYVGLALKPKAEKQKSPEERERYIFLEALAEELKDPKLLRDQLLNILLAGRDTTSSLLSSVFYLLARDHRVWEKLRREILNNFGTINEPKREITFSSLKDIPYLRYVLDETLRLYPPVPLNARTAIKDTTIPVGGGPDGLSPVFISKGQDVSYSVWAMHRREDLWGADAAKFRPERWEGSKMRGWQYLPFNGGPRICLGQQYALTEAGFVVVRLLQNFEAIENAGEKTGEPLLNANLTMSHHAGVHIRLFPATEKA